MKTMYVCLAFAMSVLALSAQTPENQRKQLTPEQRVEQQVERMEKQLLLDDETAAKFAPLYKEYIEALAQCRPAAPKEKIKPRQEKLTDEAIDQRMQARFELQKKRLDVKETYYKKFKEILTMRQVEKIFAPQPKKHAPRFTPEKRPFKAPLPPEKLVR